MTRPPSNDLSSLTIRTSFSPSGGLIVKTDGHQLRGFLEQLVVHGACLPELVGRLKLRRQHRLHLTKPDHVETRIVYVRARDEAGRPPTNPDRTISGPM